MARKKKTKIVEKEYLVIDGHNTHFEKMGFYDLIQYFKDCEHDNTDEELIVLEKVGENNFKRVHVEFAQPEPSFTIEDYK
jgi:hypothetical protein